MAVKKCQKCGKKNPLFFTHCVDCGTKLETEPGRPSGLNPCVKAGIVIGIFLLVLVFVIVPLIRFSLHSGQSFSEEIRNKTGTEEPTVIEYPIGETADNGRLRVQVTSFRDSQNTFNSQKFFVVSVYLQNLQSNRNVLISNNDFELIGSDNNRYLPYGIGSQVQVHLRPGQTTGQEVTYVIPQKISGTKLRFTFPNEYGQGASSMVFIFDLQ